MNRLVSSLKELEQAPPGSVSSALAKQVLEGAPSVKADRELIIRYLNLTGTRKFMVALVSREERTRWAESATELIAGSEYHLREMFARSAGLYPDRNLFEDYAVVGDPSLFNYRYIGIRLKTIAAALYRSNRQPRVAIMAANSVDGACCDLACLMYDIFVTPLNVHTKADNIKWIFDRLRINVVIADTLELAHELQRVRSRVDHQFEIVAIDPLASEDTFEGRRLLELTVPISPALADVELGGRERLNYDDVATVMFTSGSTGVPKGIAFSIYNLISKRFCRGAALPEVGDREKLICFLPLYHTFGRFLEMMGMIYWGGTYVFPGNPSADTLFSLMPKINPTGLISVPVRWQQIYERCLEVGESATSPEERERSFRKVVGSRLCWGLSAAGYLAPQVFRYFNQRKVALCSGFGMTEGTGGITMTPPGEYRENSIGIPLPGIRTRQSAEGELQISGAYVARYLEDLGETFRIPLKEKKGEEYWLATGDLFRELDDGHYEIVDRLKDIYKNAKGQTIAPRKVEKKFEGVPGVKRTFLVGDARNYNVLLIVVDREDPVIEGFKTSDKIRDYLDQIVRSANEDLAPYERIVNFAPLERDFSEEKGELTPKGTLRRKVLEVNFSEVIEGLYHRRYVAHEINGYQVLVPRWLVRDMGILESDIERSENGLYDRYRDCHLRIQPTDREKEVIVGDLIYRIDGEKIDLGLFSRQPFHWLGNSQLMAFCPCKEGWDVLSGAVHSRVYHPGTNYTPLSVDERYLLDEIRDYRLREINELVVQSMGYELSSAIEAVLELGNQLRHADQRLASLIRYRLEGLSRHPEFGVRTQAYQVLLLDRPSKDYSQLLPAFIDSGLPFLDAESIEKLASTNLSRHRLESLRQRLFIYRMRMSWPTDSQTRDLFVSLLTLLKDFAGYHPEYYDAVRAELAAWILHESDPTISEIARSLFVEMYGKFERRLDNESIVISEEDWERLVVFGDELRDSEVKRLKNVLFGTNFVRQSIMLAFDELSFEMDEVLPSGIWVTRILARHHYRRYRLSINCRNGRHFDIQVILSDDVRTERVLQTVYWLMAVSSYPYGPRVLPRLGCCRTELGARSLVYVGDLTVWERIRELATSRQEASKDFTARSWRKLFTHGMGAFFRAWKISGGRIVPGVPAPENVVVPDQDFREGSMVASLTDWIPYESPRSLVKPLLSNFIMRNAALYPVAKEYLHVSWIFDACVHGLGKEPAIEFLTELRDDLVENGTEIEKGKLLDELSIFLELIEREWWVPPPVQYAIDRYHEWMVATPESTPSAREQLVMELFRLYRFDRFDEIARYYLYRHTYFSDANETIVRAFDDLIAALFAHPDQPAHRMIELSDLQAALETDDQRQVFAVMVFYRTPQPLELEVMTVGEEGLRQVIMTTRLTDKHGEVFTVREPTEPSEIGHLHRLFFRGGYPKTVSAKDRFLVVVSEDGHIVGGLCYRMEGEDVVHLDGSVIAASVSGRGIGGALLEDFCNRMVNENRRIVKTHYFMRHFYLKRGFRVDQRWGALVRFLQPPRIPVEEQ